MTATPHTVLGVSPDATADQIRTARRELARRHHPDVGGDPNAMQRINEAAANALRLLQTRTNDHGDPPGASPDDIDDDTGWRNDWVGQTHDAPSFVVEALPVEAFEALRIAACELGEAIDEDPPYELRVLLSRPLRCWCQLDVVPDAGSSTVSVSIATVDGDGLPSIIDVRNAWITALNALDWSTL